MRRSRLTLYLAAGITCAALSLAALRASSHRHSAVNAAPLPPVDVDVPVPVPDLTPPDPISSARARLERFEAEHRQATDFEHLPPANRTHGADPYALAHLDATHLIGVLRGASAVVLLDTHLHELQRLELPGDIVAVAVTSPRECWVGGETSHSVLRLRFDGRQLTRAGQLSIPGILGIRALAPGKNGLVYALDVHDGKLFTLRSDRDHEAILDSRVVGHGPLAVRQVGPFLLVNLLLDHALVLYQLDADGRIANERARIQHDGPIWGFDAALLPHGELLLTLTGVEDHPLDRSDGSFGYIDSFAFAYLLPEHGAPRELWRSNVAELGVVTPKAPLLHLTGTSASLFLTGYGSDRALELYFDTRSTHALRAQSEPFYPGTSAGVPMPSGELAFADPLLDAWLLRPASGERRTPASVQPVLAPSAPLATTEERLGEALFFTSLMAPANSSEGAHSRFTCETCHFEGYVDGRVHYTGRDDVRVATKPLRGLFNNRPHFSRALDADLATVSHHEFRVAGKGNGADPWFAIQSKDYFWLEQLGVRETTLDPEALRRALISFLMRFSHTTNPAVVGRQQLEANERHGAELFRARCIRCHAPRLQTDVPHSALPFEAWPGAIFSATGPVVWASAEYQKTGVTPYVHEAGTRVPSLRRLYAKWPHFTNGSAHTVLDVVSRARFDDAHFFHANAPAALHAFSPEEARDLTAFLELL